MLKQIFALVRLEEPIPADLEEKPEKPLIISINSYLGFEFLQLIQKYSSMIPKDNQVSQYQDVRFIYIRF